MKERNGREESEVRKCIYPSRFTLPLAIVLVIGWLGLEIVFGVDACWLLWVWLPLIIVDFVTSGPTES